MKQIYFISIFFLILASGKAQIGGESTYQFLELTNSARMAALGGNQVALYDTADLNLPYHNPAALQSSMENILLVNYVNYLADINYGYVSFARSYEGIGNFALGMHYINYGDFLEATEEGELTGNNFSAAEYALNIIYSNQFKRWRYGANLKPILSSLESYRSFGIALDLGVSYASLDKYTNVALVARNIGTQITTYYEDGNREAIPFDLQAGISRRLKHAPVHLSLTLQHLNKWDLASEEKDDDELDISINDREESMAKQFMRHVVLGVEVLPSDNFIIRAGYNYQRRQELKFDEKLSTVGMSLGFGVKIKRFRLDFATTRYHLAGSSNHFSLAINLNDKF
ncbi:type IX secretion system protein PorQ [Maribellus maritimus]|uniref:type IX secretion system protein PorQ n=1 Tax=Maribellus maritimus TaxID=2870838 RepID=UPI001EE9FC38|nr:type IX secretion system protein PorQ [Maribellus maritimus]MCG6186652.1 type IX secretion system protein PorQ [Maribellus maritimus]